MTTATVSAVKLCGVAAVAMALLCVAAVEAKALPKELMTGAKPITIYPGIGRYSIHDESKNWTQAHKECSNGKGHLAIINSEEEAAIILEIMETMNRLYIHIGLHDAFGEGKFVSVRGEALENLGYQTWAAGQPAGGTKNNYCAFKNAGTGSISTGLYDIPSTTQYPFICELPMWEDYEFIPGMGYYKLHNELSLWQESWEICRSEGAYLLLFTSTVERDLVVDKYLGDITSNYVWYGAHQTFADQHFVTIFDEPLDDSGFNTWSTGYPGLYHPNTAYPNIALRVINGYQRDLFLFTSATKLSFICKHDLHDRA